MPYFHSIFCASLLLFSLLCLSLLVVNDNKSALFHYVTKPVPAFFDGSLELIRCMIDVDQTEVTRVTATPLQVIQKRPMEDACQIHAILNLGFVRLTPVIGQELHTVIIIHAALNIATGENVSPLLHSSNPTPFSATSSFIPGHRFPIHLSTFPNPSGYLLK